MELNNDQKQYINGYATALQDILLRLTGEDNRAKSYDPVFFREDYIYSYCYDLKDGSRRHPISDYDSVNEITTLMVEETFNDIMEAI